MCPAGAVWAPQAREDFAVPHDKRKTAARTLAAKTGLPYTAAWRAAADAHHFEAALPDTLLPRADVADRVTAEGRVDRLPLGLTWGEASLAVIAARLAEFLTEVMDAPDDQAARAILADRREEMDALVRYAGLDDFDQGALNRALHALPLDAAPGVRP